MPEEETLVLFNPLTLQVDECSHQHYQLLFFRADALNLKLLKGVGAELVGNTLPDAMTFDHVTGLNSVGQEDHLAAHRAACPFDLSHAPHPFGLARPEREPGSVRAVKDPTAFDPHRDLDLLPSPVARNLCHGHTM